MDTSGPLRVEGAREACGQPDGGTCRKLMCREGKTFRLAIGLFSEGGPLARALGELADREVDARNLCLVGSSRSLSPDFLPAPSQGAEIRYQMLFEKVEDAGGIFAPVECRASLCPFLDILREPADSPDGCGRLPAWLSETQRKRLAHHVAGGALVLIVSSETPTQQDTCCRILLRHSQHGVQTHDFTL